MDNTGDFALVQLEDSDAFSSDNNPETFNNQQRDVSSSDHLLQVNVRGRKTVGTGFVIDVVENNMGIQYNLGQTQLFDKVILVGNQASTNCSPASADGDSGGAVFDNQNQLIGIIAGLTPKFSIVLPLQTPIANLSLTIK